VPEVESQQERQWSKQFAGYEPVRTHTQKIQANPFQHVRRPWAASPSEILEPAQANAGYVELLIRQVEHDLRFESLLQLEEYWI
jgi:hypothetical protein